MSDYLETVTGLPTHKSGIWNVEISSAGRMLAKWHEADPRLQTPEQVKALAIERLDFRITFNNLKP